MERENVYLLTKNPLLVKWCALEMTGEFCFNTNLHDQYRNLLNMTELPICVVADSAFCDECSMLQIYDYIISVLHIPFVLLFTGKKSATKAMRDVFRKAYFVTVNSDCGDLRFLLRDIAYRTKSKEKTSLPKRLSSASKGPFDITKFNLKIRQVAKSDEPVLLLGESGSGKSYAARKIHELSPLRAGPFCSINVAELSSSIAQSQLFGTVKGAYTDALNAPGLFEQADGGTLFLDEIADLDLEVQSKILNAIETKTFRRVGGVKEHTFNTRLIFATNADLHERVKKGLFRPDLFYRIDVLSVYVPPLRDHREDIPRIAEECAHEKHKSIAPKALEKLCSFSWPGNIRQLRNSVFKACALSEKNVLTEEDFDFLSV